MMIPTEVAAEVEARHASGLAFSRRLRAFARELIASAHQAAGAGGAAERLTLFFLARGSTAALAVETLFCMGLETDAAASARTLSELLIDLSWLWHEHDEERMRLFIEYVHVLNHRRLEAIRAAGATSGRLPDAEAAFDRFRGLAPVDSGAELLLEIEAQYQRVKANYPKAHQWSEKSIRQRAQDVQLEHIYDLVFRFGSEAAHSGAATLASLYNVDGNVVSLHDEPTIPTSDEVLLLASWCHLGLLDTAVRHVESLGAAHTPSISTLGADLDVLFKQQAG